MPPRSHTSTSLIVPQKISADEISSPDLGVDVSSDQPFSSLERNGEQRRHGNREGKI